MRDVRGAYLARRPLSGALMRRISSCTAGPRAAGGSVRLVELGARAGCVHSPSRPAIAQLLAEVIFRCRIGDLDPSPTHIRRRRMVRIGRLIAQAGFATRGWSYIVECGARRRGKPTAEERAKRRDEERGHPDPKQPRSIERERRSLTEERRAGRKQAPKLEVLAGASLPARRRVLVDREARDSQARGDCGARDARHRGCASIADIE